FFFQAEDGIRDKLVTGVQTCALPICRGRTCSERMRVWNCGKACRTRHRLRRRRRQHFYGPLAPTRPSHQKIAWRSTWRCTTRARSEERRVGKECRWGGEGEEEERKR